MQKNIERVKPIIAIVLILIWYRIIAFGIKTCLPFDTFSFINFLSDILAFTLTYYVVRFFVRRSFKNEVLWWIVLLISILPAIVIIVLFRILLLLIF